MKEWVHKNPTIAFGIGLPLLLVMVIVLAAAIPGMLVPPPVYDVVFSTNGYYSGQEGLHISVVNGKAKAVWVGNCNYCSIPEVYRYNATKHTITRLDFMLPPEVKQRIAAGNDDVKKGFYPVEIPALEQLTLNAENPSPDGYEFLTREYYSGASLVPGLFFSRSYNNDPILQKQGNRIRVPLSQGYYGAAGANFIGWVVSHD